MMDDVESIIAPDKSMEITKHIQHGTETLNESVELAKSSDMTTAVNEHSTRSEENFLAKDNVVESINKSDVLNRVLKGTDKNVKVSKSSEMTTEVSQHTTRVEENLQAKDKVIDGATKNDVNDGLSKKVSESTDKSEKVSESSEKIMEVSENSTRVNENFQASDNVLGFAKSNDVSEKAKKVEKEEQGKGFVHKANDRECSAPIVVSEAANQLQSLLEQLKAECKPPILTPRQLRRLDIYTSPQQLTPASGVAEADKPRLRTVLNYASRMHTVSDRLYYRHLKYRSTRWTQEAEAVPDPSLPLNEVAVSVRVYRPYATNGGRPPVFRQEIELYGASRLTALRDLIRCPNDLGLRADLSENPDEDCHPDQRQLFPSGYFFINNVFYVDMRAPNSVDLAAPIAAWCESRGMGVLPRRDMHEVRVRDLCLRLGHPDVYIHQGNCEHIITPSSIRLVALAPGAPPAQLNSFAIANTVYCCTCAELAARWIVTNNPRLAFDPGYFCDTCFRQYNYVDGRKVSEFKAFPFYNRESVI